MGRPNHLLYLRVHEGWPEESWRHVVVGEYQHCYWHHSIYQLGGVHQTGALNEQRILPLLPRTAIVRRRDKAQDRQFCISIFHGVPAQSLTPARPRTHLAASCCAVTRRRSTSDSIALDRILSPKYIIAMVSSPTLTFPVLQGLGLFIFLTPLPRTSTVSPSCSTTGWWSSRSHRAASLFFMSSRHLFSPLIAFTLFPFLFVYLMSSSASSFHSAFLSRKAFIGFDIFSRDAQMTLSALQVWLFWLTPRRVKWVSVCLTGKLTILLTRMRPACGLGRDIWDHNSWEFIVFVYTTGQDII